MFHHVITVIYVIDVTTFVKTFRNLHIRGLGGATPPTTTPQLIINSNIFPVMANVIYPSSEERWLSALWRNILNTEPRKMKQANKALVTRFYEKKTADIFVNNGFVPLPNIVLDMMPEFGFTCQEQMLIVHIMQYQDYIVTDKQLGEKMQMSVFGIQRIKRLIKTRTMNDTPLITIKSTYDPATGKRTSSKYNLQFFFLALKEAYFDRERAVDKSEIPENPES